MPTRLCSRTAVVAHVISTEFRAVCCRFVTSSIALLVCVGLLTVQRSLPTWRFMGTFNSNDKPTYNLLRGLGWLISAAIIGVISALNIQASHNSPSLHHEEPAYPALFLRSVFCCVCVFLPFHDSRNAFRSWEQPVPVLGTCDHCLGHAAFRSLCWFWLGFFRATFTILSYYDIFSLYCHITISFYCYFRYIIEMLLKH